MPEMEITLTPLSECPQQMEQRSGLRPESVPGSPFELQPQDVLGTGDDRFVVLSTVKEPFRFIGRLTIFFGGGSPIVGTGVMVDRAHVLTAAHNLFDGGNFATAASFAPAQDGESKPFPEATGRQIFIPAEYQQTQSGPFDFAILALNQAIGVNTGFFGIKAFPANSLQGLAVTIAGYPTAVDEVHNQPPRMFGHKGAVTAVCDHRLAYDIDTSGGQSGSGVWLFDADGAPKLVGVHTDGRPPSNGSDCSALHNNGTRLTAGKIALIDSWILQSPLIVS